MGIQGMGNWFDQWNVIAIEAGPVTQVTCSYQNSQLFRFEFPVDKQATNPWPGEHYGNVGLCRGWIDGGNGPVSINVTYTSAKKGK